MVLLAFHPRIFTHILSCRAPPRVCGDSYQHFRLDALQCGALPSQLPVPRLRLLRRRLYHWDLSWHGWKGSLCSLDQDIGNVGTGWQRPDARPGGKGD